MDESLAPVAKQPDQQAQQPGQGVPPVSNLLNQQAVTSHRAGEESGEELPKHSGRNLWKSAFKELESTDADMMGRFRKLMIRTLLTVDTSASTELDSEQNWKLMEDFVSKQLALATDPTKTETLDKLDQSLRIVRTIIEVANEPIKLIPEASAAWAGLNVAVTVS